MNKNFDFYVHEDENAECSFGEISWATEQEKKQLSSFTFERSNKGNFKNARILVEGLQFRYICFVYSFILFKSTMLILRIFGYLIVNSAVLAGDI